MDYKIQNYYYQLATNTGELNTLFNAGYTNKEFGAYSFYTPKYPDQFEIIGCSFLSWCSKYQASLLNTK